MNRNGQGLGSHGAHNQNGETHLNQIVAQRNAQLETKISAVKEKDTVL